MPARVVVSTRRNLSLGEVRAMYDSLRRRFFLDAAPPLRVPPPSAELRWGWLPESSGALGETQFDEDGDPEMIRVAFYDRSRTILRGTLLHEMTHMRLGAEYACGSGTRRHGMRTLPASSMWRQEALRLVQLGALQL